MFVCGIGQDSHRFDVESSTKQLVLGGVRIPGAPGLLGNSDADVVLHALTNAISGISCVNILGKISDEMCLTQGITDSKAYLKKAIDSLGNTRMVHISISIEGQRPKLYNYILSIRQSIAELCSLPVQSVGFTATTGEDLTAFGKGEGMQAFVIVTADTI